MTRLNCALEIMAEKRRSLTCQFCNELYSGGRKRHERLQVGGQWSQQPCWDNPYRKCRERRQWSLCNLIHQGQRASVQGMGRRKHPCVAQDAMFGEDVRVGGDDGYLLHPVGNVEKGGLAAGGLEDEEDVGWVPLVVALGPSTQEVAAVGLQAFGDALRRGGPALELQQEGTAPAFVLQGEGGVGMDDVGGPVVAVADAGAVGGGSRSNRS